MPNIDPKRLWEALATTVALASFLRLLLHWLEGGLAIWIKRKPESAFWGFYDKLQATVAYVAVSLQAFGKKSNGERKP